MATKNKTVKAEKTKAPKAKVDEVVTNEQVSNEAVKTDEVKAEKTNAPKVLKFPKDKLVGSKKFIKHRDLIKVLLDEKKTYSIAEVEGLIKDFLNGKIKIK